MLQKGKRVVFNGVDALNRDFPTLESIPPAVICEDPHTRSSERAARDFGKSQLDKFKSL